MSVRPGASGAAARRGSSLQMRLVAVCSGIALAGIALVAFASWASMRHTLIGRADQRIDRMMRSSVGTCLSTATGADAAQECTQPPRPPAPGQAPPRAGAGGQAAQGQQLDLPQGSWIALVDEDGEVVASRSAPGLDGAAQAQVEVPSTARLRELAEAPPTSVEIAGREYRVASHAARGGGLLVSAIPLEDVRATTASLVRVEVAVAAGAALLVVLASFAAVRAGFAPLRRITRRAGELAHDDRLDARLPGGDGGVPSEIAQLSEALNAMLDRTEGMFEQRRRSEAKLRQFVGDASHELRTPIAAISGHAQLLLRAEPTGGAHERRDRLGRIDAQAAHLGALVDDLLDLARLDRGDQLELDDVDLVQLCRTAVADITAADPACTYAFVDEGASGSGGEAGVVRVDAVLVRRALHNLLGNCAAHTPAGTRVEVSVVGDADAAVIAVEDDGPGIAAADRERAFGRFWRAAGSRATGSGGSGLGLSFVLAAAQAHGGSAGLAPGELGGLRVELRLPRPG